MGTYVYRVTAKLVELNDGRRAHVAKYAFKPYYSGLDADKLNKRMAFQSGCIASEKLTLKSDLLVTLSIDGKAGSLYANPKGLKVFNDDNTFGTKRMPLIGDVNRGSVPDFYVIDYNVPDGREQG